MTQTVVFRTPGKLDLRSLTVFGLNAKPNTSNPIGYFGTGLKYAIATLARHNVPITIYIGDKQWSIAHQHSEFRTKKFGAVFLIRHQKLLGTRAIPLPFTTELGKNWELWQAFRELYANTIDENGEVEDDEGDYDPDPSQIGDNTEIIVRSDEFMECYYRRNEIFLPEALTQRTETSGGVQIIKTPSMYIYWRGMRILKIDEPQGSLFTYNILNQIDLTEDRTAKYSGQVSDVIKKAIATSEDSNLIDSITALDNKWFEGNLDINYSIWESYQPSDTFRNTVASRVHRHDHVNLPALRLYERSKPPEPPIKLSLEELRNQLVTTIDHQEWDKVLDLIQNHRTETMNLLLAGLPLNAAAKLRSTVIDDDPTSKFERMKHAERTRDDIPF